MPIRVDHLHPIVMYSLKFALRSLAGSPSFVIITVLTLALGIGLNTSMFSLVNALMLRPLPFEAPEQLVRLQRSTPSNARGGFSPGDYIDLKRTESGFGEFAAYSGGSVTLSEAGHSAEPQNLMRVTTNFLNVLKVEPLLGRNFRADEEIAGNHRVVILSHTFWQSRFAGTADVIGLTVKLDGEPHEIIGVLPAWATERRPFESARLFRPVGFSNTDRATRDNGWLSVIGRRSPKLSVADGEAYVAAQGARIAAAFPAENKGSSWQVDDLLASNMNPVGRAIVFMLLGLSGCVLLIACSNLANLLLARTIARTREFAVRSALGASRFELFKPLAIESFLLAVAGGASALVVARWTSDWLSAQSATDGARPLDLPLDWRVLGFALLASVVTAITFGIAPAVFTTRVNINDTLKSQSRGATGDRRQHRLRHALIVGQFALAMILLAGAGFFLRGAGNLLNQNHGWDAAAIIQGTLLPPGATYKDEAQIAALHRHVLERLQTLPGVESASLSYSLPYFSMAGPRKYIVEGRPVPSDGQEPSARYNGVSAGYFRTTGTPLRRGRPFTVADNASSPKVVVISESMARVLFPTEDPLGRRIAEPVAGTPQWCEIVGIAADVKSIDVSASSNDFQVYHPLLQEIRGSVSLAVRATQVAPTSLLDSIRKTIAEIDPDLPVRDLMPVTKILEHTASDFRMINQLLTTFSLLGVGLAALGIYGTIARSVAQRTNEIGIRMALGAQVTDVTKMMLASGIRLAVVGAVIGLVGAFGLSRVIASAMPAMQSNGSLVLAAATGLLVLIALLACYLPARSAAKIDPVVSLRAQ